ncbi:MAG: hypothetical protein ACI9JY_000480, partial [Saprospiraceae bacterium]
AVIFSFKEFKKSLHSLRYGTIFCVFLKGKGQA